MALEGRGRLSRRKDGKDFLYLPKSLVEDSAFPFKPGSSIPVRVVIDMKEERVLILPLDKDKRRREKKA